MRHHRALNALRDAQWRLPEPGLPASGDLLLTPSQACELYQQLTGRTIRRNRWHALARHGQVDSERRSVTTEQVYIPLREVERLAAEGLPDPLPSGRPRKSAE